jgi:hypothetical protein
MGRRKGIGEEGKGRGKREEIREGKWRGEREKRHAARHPPGKDSASTINGKKKEIEKGKSGWV